MRVTGKGETPWSFFSILINLLGSHAKAWNYEGEQLLRASSLDYTIVRPGVMGTASELAADSLALADDGGDLKVSAIPHAAVAALCVEALDAPGAARATLTAMCVEPGDGAASWAPLLAAVRPDRRAFRDDLLAEHYKAVRVGAAALALVGAAVLSGVVAAAKAVAGAVAALLLR